MAHPNRDREIYLDANATTRVLLYGATEHKAVPQALRHWTSILGLPHEVIAIPVDVRGQLDLAFLAAHRARADLVCTMAVNNETGVIHDPARIDTHLHVDHESCRTDLLERLLDPNAPMTLEEFRREKPLLDDRIDDAANTELVCGAIAPPCRYAASLDIAPEGRGKFFEEHRGALVIDVREPHEYRFVRDWESLGLREPPRNVPLTRLTSYLQSLLASHPEPNGLQVICLCRSGYRSGRVAEVLRRAGVEQAWNLTGGLALGDSRRIATVEGTLTLRPVSSTGDQRHAILSGTVRFTDEGPDRFSDDGRLEIVLSYAPDQARARTLRGTFESTYPRTDPRQNRTRQLALQAVFESRPE